MCGIVGICGRPRDGALAGAVATIVHRGPDDAGRYEDAQVAIAHQRLSIIDIAHGHQPMHSPDGRYVLAFNGEIYNFRELRKRLEGTGHSFRTSSDTEVLLQWLGCKWRDGLADLNGMFALALWDRRERRLLLARDRVGIKPLYVLPTGDGGLVFASEVKAILAVSGRLEPNLPAIFQFLTFQNVLTEDTFFRNVSKLPPSGWLEWSPTGITRGTFWTPVFDYGFNGHFTEIIRTFRATLERSVERHMIADVPVGSYLSGGIDSSAVTIVAARHSQQPLHTFTGAFTDAPYYDERVGARAVAGKAGATLHEIEITADDFCDNFGRVVYHLDEPTVGTGALPQYMVSKLAAAHVKVVLTGHGGDEAFAGYQVNKATLIRALLAKKPLAALGQMARVKPDEFSRVLYYGLYPLIHPEVKYGLFIMTPRNQRRRRLTAAFLSAMGDYEPLEEIDRFTRGKTPAEALQILYLRTYLPTLFIQEDKVGMAHSLEARMPLCDNELIDLSFRLDLEHKLHGGALKAIPRAAMRGELPDILYQLPKRGFPTPYARWFRQGRARELMADLLLSERAAGRGIFAPAYVADLFTRHVNARTDTLFDYARANELYSIAAIELWFRTFIDPPVARAVC
jgi:asparagine synthase (glutamine-hydrolysing)